MWMPAQTTVPPLRTARKAVGTSAPTGAKMSAASRLAGVATSLAAARVQPSSSAKACAAASPARVNA